MPNVSDMFLRTSATAVCSRFSQTSPPLDYRRKRTLPTFAARQAPMRPGAISSVACVVSLLMVGLNLILCWNSSHLLRPDASHTKSKEGPRRPFSLTAEARNFCSGKSICVTIEIPVCLPVHLVYRYPLAVPAPSLSLSFESCCSVG